MDNIPHTEQGLKDYIRAGKKTLKDWEKRKPELELMIAKCEAKLREIHNDQARMAGPSSING